MKIIQINLQHCKAASALLSKRLIEDNVDIALIQEQGLNKRDQMYKGIYI